MPTPKPLRVIAMEYIAKHKSGDSRSELDRFLAKECAEYPSPNGAIETVRRHLQRYNEINRLKRAAKKE